MIFLLLLLSYFGLLYAISVFVGRKKSDNETFFRANKQSPWWIVAIGMIGTSISGVTFVSVPGMVRDVNFHYLQMVLGFFFGYVIIANVLLPLYYKLNLTSIYSYLGTRFGKTTYKTGSSFFFIGKMVGAAARLYIVAIILQQLVFDALNIPFWMTASATVLMIWLYTHQTGIGTVIWTDTLQTIVMVVALVLIIVEVSSRLQLNFTELTDAFIQNSKTKIFLFDDWYSKQNFWKQFLSGVFIPIVMTGLDQDMMQKNLTIRTLKDAKKNIYWYGIAFLPINFLFLLLGALLLMLASKEGIALPAISDEILPFFATQHLGLSVYVLFVIGIIAAAFSSADSALTALTTSFSVDILGLDKNKDKQQSTKIRKRVHFGFTLLLIFVILLFKLINDKSVIDAIYTIVSYTYGPLLGLFAFGLFTKFQIKEKFVPFLTILSPIISFLIVYMAQNQFSYSFGYEVVLLNGAITFFGLYLIKLKTDNLLSKPLH